MLRKRRRSLCVSRRDPDHAALNVVEDPVVNETIKHRFVAELAASPRVLWPQSTASIDTERMRLASLARSGCQRHGLDVSGISTDVDTVHELKQGPDRATPRTCHQNCIFL